MKYINNIKIIYFCFLLLFLTKGVFSLKYLKLPINIIGFPKKEELSSIEADLLLIKLSKIKIQTHITIGTSKQIISRRFFIRTLSSICFKYSL